MHIINSLKVTSERIGKLEQDLSIEKAKLRPSMEKKHLENMEKRQATIVHSSPMVKRRRNPNPIISHDTPALPKKSRSERAAETSTKSNLDPLPTEILDELEQSRQENNKLQVEINDLTSNIRNLEIKHEDLSDACTNLKCNLLYNADFDCQISSEDVMKICKDLQQYDGVNEREVVRLKSSCYTPNICDTFDSLQLKPHLPIKEHIYILFYSLPNNSSEDTQPDYGEKVGKYHMMWLSTQVESVVHACFDSQTNRIFTWWMEQMINSHALTGLGRASLFLFVGNLTTRTLDFNVRSLWWMLHDVIYKDNMLSPAEDWDILEFICFCYFLSVGPTECLLLRDMIKDAPKTFEFIQKLRGKIVMDMIGLLSEDCVLEVIQRYHPSAMLHSLSQKESRMIILRTYPPLKESAITEYIWTREYNVVTLSTDGFEMEIEEKLDERMVLHVRAKGETFKNWFSYDIEGDDDNAFVYFENYHKDCCKGAFDLLHKMLGFHPEVLWNDDVMEEKVAKVEDDE